MNFTKKEKESRLMLYHVVFGSIRQYLEKVSQVKHPSWMMNKLIECTRETGVGHTLLSKLQRKSTNLFAIL